MATFYQQLRNREVTRVAAAYVSVAWLIIEALDNVSEPLGIPLWISTVTIYSLVVGFPIALVLSWLYRLTPEGRIEREEDAAELVPARLGGRKIDFVIIGALALAVIFLLIGNRPLTETRARDSGELRPVVTSIRKLSTTRVHLTAESSVFPLVVDASRIYFLNFIDPAGYFGISQMARAGGDFQVFELPFDPLVTGVVPDRMSHDKSALVVNTFGASDLNAPMEMWELPIAGGSPRKITDGYQSALSPDGTTMMFRRGMVDLYIGNADGSSARKVFSAPGVSVYWLRFSRDGKRVRFTVFVDHFAGQIWEYSLETGDAHEVLPDWNARSACCGSWTPDGQYYVFEAAHDAGPQIWAVRDLPREDGVSNDPVQLTTASLDFKYPAIPDEGNKIYAIGWQLRGEVVEKSPDDMRFHSIEGLESMSIEHVNFSKDRSRIAYVSYPQGNLWTKNMLDGTSQQLTFGYTRIADPKLSPDGSMIAYEAWVPGNPKKIHVIRVAGGDATLVSNPETYSWSPSWSPDGTKLMFSEASDRSPRIYDMLLETTTDLRLGDAVYSAVWSPDGKSLAGKSKREEHIYDLVLYDFDDGTIEILARDMRSKVRGWSADGNRIYLVDRWWTFEDKAVYSLDIRDKTMTKIVVFGDERPVWGTETEWVGVTPEGVVMLLRDHSIHNIYELTWGLGPPAP